MQFQLNRIVRLEKRWISGIKLEIDPFNQRFVLFRGKQRSPLLYVARSSEDIRGCPLFFQKLRFDVGTELVEIGRFC